MGAAIDSEVEYVECVWSEETPDACPYCSGEACSKCGAGMGYTEHICTHDSLERHEKWPSWREGSADVSKSEAV